MKEEIMRRFSLKFGIAMLTFVVGVGATTGWYLFRPRFSRAVEEENIMEAVFRYQIAEERSPEGKGVIFLSVAQDMDPSDDFMRRLAEMPVVRKISQANKRGDGVTDKQTGERGIILDVHRLEWISDAEVRVAVGTYAWGWGQSGSVCRVVHQTDKWVVQGCELTLIT
jgi:hypothetical protein